MTKQIDKEEVMKQLEKEGLLKHLDKEEVMKWIDKEYEEFVRLSGPSFDWVEALLTVLIMVITVGGFSMYLTHLIEMVVEHKFVWWRSVIDIFWAIVFLSQWVYHLAKMLMWKFK